MIKVFLRGGLGNQMFQYAAALGIAKKNDTTFALDATYLNDRSPRFGFTRRNYDLDVFAVSPSLTSLSTISGAVPIPGLWLGLDFIGAIAGDLLGVKKFIRERGNFIVDERVTRAGHSATLWGFWQTEKYFADAKKEVRDVFRFKPSSDPAVMQAKELIAHSNSVALHVRRGDYLLPNSMKVLGVVGDGYYDSAIAYISEYVPSPHFFVFSDDIAWCRKHIKVPGPVIFMDDATAGPKASGHLELMSLCKHNIIANSTFSWWGAWLNANPEKIVVAPKQWFMGNDKNANSIVPADWIRI